MEIIFPLEMKVRIGAKGERAEVLRMLVEAADFDTSQIRLELPDDQEEMQSLLDSSVNDGWVTIDIEKVQPISQGHWVTQRDYERFVSDAFRDNRSGFWRKLWWVKDEAGLDVIGRPEHFRISLQSPRRAVDDMEAYRAGSLRPGAILVIDWDGWGYKTYDKLKRFVEWVERDLCELKEGA